ncbi:cysteine-rich CWC family protein [Chlorobium sp. BLA1]|uniref:cysteine-rich CWC family protein n=1 Tax=Candidatus Chlorobium masyuteum TaxID=2716876 RepID=UPI001423BBFD|nr:cysteine-rich CWC family protein [Candidatus Chlorobium masyuteum]NHQ59865.1 cysteine-rich CWC family protein [Candidatus Chlorobium masyuteum]
MSHAIEHESGTPAVETCPMCGTSFTCARAATCWCSTRKVPSEVREYLAERYETCVCSNCLDRLTEKAKAGEKL